MTLDVGIPDEREDTRHLVAARYQDFGLGLFKNNRENEISIRIRVLNVCTLTESCFEPLASVM